MEIMDGVYENVKCKAMMLNIFCNVHMWMPTGVQHFGNRRCISLNGKFHFCIYLQWLDCGSIVTLRLMCRQCKKIYSSIGDYG